MVLEARAKEGQYGEPLPSLLLELHVDAVCTVCAWGVCIVCVCCYQWPGTHSPDGMVVLPERPKPLVGALMSPCMITTEEPLNTG